MAKSTLIDPSELASIIEKLQLRLESLEKNTLPNIRNITTSNEQMIQAFHAITDRLEALEVDVKTIRPDNLPLPQEIREGVSPSELFTEAFRASLTAFIISNPQGMMLSRGKTAYASRSNAIDSALAIAEATLDRIRNRINNSPVETPEPVTP